MIQAGLLAMLLTMNRVGRAPAQHEALQVVNLDVPQPSPSPPPPPRRKPPPEHRPKHEAGGSPPKAAAPVFAAPVPLAKPVIPAAVVPASGSALTGRGAGFGNGTGTGTGSGSGNGSGTGTGDEGGSGGDWIGGRIEPRDYPKAARDANQEGTVSTEITVGVNGRATACRVTRSSGSAALDETTCRLALQRFRYRPATDANGRPVPEVVDYDQEWLLRDLKAD